MPAGAKALLAAASVLLALAVAQSASAAQCGDSDPKGGKTRGTLELNGEQSTTELTYKRETDPQDLLLVFKVVGCELPAGGEEVEFEALPKGTPQLPRGVVRLDRARPDGQELSLRVTVDATKFEPDSYRGLGETRAPYLVTNRVPLSLSRSTSNWLTPFAIGAISGLVAVIWFALLKFLARQKLEIAWPWLIVVALAAAVAGGLAVASAWLDQDVWTVDANIKAAVIAGVSGATTGSMAGLLAVVWKAPPKE